MRNLIHLGVVTIVAAFAACNEGCLPKLAPDAVGMEKLYNAQLAKCSAELPTLRAICQCRKNVDIEWGVCDQDKWYPTGRCTAECEKLP